MFQIYKCIVCCITHILLDILGFCFCNWVYCIFWGFCVWLYFWRCLLIALVYSLSCFTWSCRSSSNNFDQYFDTVVFNCGRLFSCREYPTGFCLFEICLFFNISHMLIYCSFMSWRVRLYVSISGILFVTWFFWYSRCALSVVNIFEISCCISLTV